MMWATLNTEPKILNTALMQTWQYCKENGIEVENYQPLHRHEYEKVFAYSLFDFTDKSNVPHGAIKGGTGFDVQSRLPPEIEACGYDYSAYPEDNQVWKHGQYSIIWFSRGCFRACEFCLVCKKEGRIRPVEPKNLNPNGKYIRVQDNNFFANPKWDDAIDQLKTWGQKVTFEGIDIRLLDDDQVEALLSLKHHGQIKIAWDDPRQDLEPKLKWLAKKIKPSKIMCYVLIGYPFKNYGESTEQDNLHRVKIISELGMDPFVMAYDKHNKIQQNFARYVNPPGVPYKKISWDQYDPLFSFKHWRTEKPMAAEVNSKLEV